MTAKLHKLIERAHKVHDEQYDYSLWTFYGGTSGEYHTKNIPVVCNTHGKFLTSVANHLRGSGCPACGRLSAISSTRKTKQFYIDKASKIHNNKYDYSLWTSTNNSSKDKVTILCNVHGEFTQTPADHINAKAGCPKCATESRRSTHIDNYGTHYKQSHISTKTLVLIDDADWLEHQHHALKKPIPQIAQELEVSDSLITTRMGKFNIAIKRFNHSKAEKEICDFIESLGVVVEQHNRSILSGKELDMWLPSHNLAIEYNGLYWHSEMTGKTYQYHLDKTKACDELGIRLIQIFSDEWEHMNQQCKDTIAHFVGKSKKGVYGRSTTIREVSWKVAKPFLDKYHLLKAGHCGNYRIGAFDSKDKLVAVMVFGHQNNENSVKGTVELRRFVTNKKNNPGVGSKMFKWACNDRGYNKIVAFVDRRWFTGLVKSHIGFKVVSETLPTLWWTNGKERNHRRFETKKSLHVKYDFPLTESKREMLHRLGFYRIWDCGKLKLEWTAD